MIPIVTTITIIASVLSLLRHSYYYYYPEGPYILPLWNSVPKDQIYYGFGGPNSTIVVYMDH